MYQIYPHKLISISDDGGLFEISSFLAENVWLLHLKLKI